MVVTLVFFIAAEAAGVVLSNAGAFLAISTLYALSLVLVTGLLGSLFDKPATAGEVRKPVISLNVAAALAAGPSLSLTTPRRSTPCFFSFFS